MGKYAFKVKIINKTDEYELFNYCKDYIKDTITQMVEALVEFDLNLAIYVRKMTENAVKLRNEDIYGNVHVGPKGAVININIEALRDIYYDDCNTLDVVLLHELAHIIDHIEIKKLNNPRLNKLGQKPRTAKDYCIRVGFHFWTEFFAYYMTFKYYKKTFNYPTFLSLVKKYKDIKKIRNNIKPVAFDVEEADEEAAEELITSIEGFTYRISKHMAGLVKGKSKNWDYSDKTKDADYEELFSKMEGLFELISKFCHCQYSKWSENRLANLGKYLIDKFYVPFNVWPIRYKGSYCLVYYFDEA